MTLTSSQPHLLIKLGLRSPLSQYLFFQNSQRTLLTVSPHPHPPPAKHHALSPLHHCPLQGLCGGPLGPAGLPFSLSRMEGEWGQLVLSLLSVTFCPLGSEPTALGHSLKKSPWQRAISMTGGQKQGPLPPFFLLPQALLRVITMTKKPCTLLPQPTAKLLCTSTHASRPWGAEPDHPLPGTPQLSVDSSFHQQSQTIRNLVNSLTLSHFTDCGKVSQ